jgi:hypothetical protein
VVLKALDVNLVKNKTNDNEDVVKYGYGQHKISGFEEEDACQTL